MDVMAGFSTKAGLVRRSKQRTVKIVAFWSIVLAALLILAAAGWLLLDWPMSVTATRVMRGPVADVVYATGFIETREPVEVSTRVTAPVSRVLVDEGDSIVRGEPLAVLDSSDLSQAIIELRAQRVNAEQDERRAQALFQQGFLARAALDKAVATANSARAAEAAAQARLNQYTVRAGIPGKVLRRDVEPGDLASPSKTLFEIGDPRFLRITATVDERDIPLVHVGAAVMMSSEAFPNRIVRGHVTDITPAGDPDERAFRVRIQPDGETNLPIGLTLEVNIMVSEKHDALLVPGGSVRQSTLWIIEDGRARQVPIKTGIQGNEKTEVVSGIAQGTCVIIQPPTNLKSGQRISADGC